MDQLGFQDFELFDRIAATRSLSVVARERGVASSNVSRALARIESACGLRLAHRSTHGLSLTDEGELFLEHARRMLAERAALRASMDPRRQAVAGTLRLAVSRLLAEYIVLPGLPQLRAEHPQLHLDILLADRLAGMVPEGIDIAIRAGVAAQEQQIVRPLARYGRRLYASPAYLQQQGEPNSVAELQAHQLIGNSAVPSHNLWHFRVGCGGPLQVQGQVRADCSAAVAALALAGAGIANLNDRVGAALVRQGRLRPVLDTQVAPGEHTIDAVVLPERHRAPRIRAVLAHLQAAFAQGPAGER